MEIERLFSLRSAIKNLLETEEDREVRDQQWVDEIASHIDGAMVTFWLTSADRVHWELSAFAGRSFTEEDAAVIALIQQAADSGSPVFTSEAGHRYFSGFPIVHNNKVRGVLAVFSEEPLPDAITFGLASLTELYSLSTVQKQTESSLKSAQESEARLRTFFDQGTHFAGILDLEGRVLDINLLALDGCGYSREEIIGKRFWECGWWNRSEAIQDLIRSGCEMARQGETFKAESVYFLADGSERFVNMVIAPVRDEFGNVINIAPTGSDITEAVEAREALQENRAALEFIRESAHLGDWEIEMDTGTARTSFRHDECFGFTKPIPPGEWTYERFLSYIHSDDRERIKAVVEESILEFRRWHEDCRVVWDDGSEHWVSIYGNIYRSAKAETIRMVGTVENISGRKLAEQKLRESRERYYNIVESITDGFKALDRDFRIIYLNKRADEIFSPTGKTSETIFGKSLWEVFPDIEHTEAGVNYRKAMAEQKTVQFEYFYTSLDIWLDIKVYPSKDGLSIFFQDVTAQKEAEGKLQKLTTSIEKQSRLYETILSSTPDLIYVFDLEHRFTYANEALLSMWGLSWEESSGKTCLELGYEDWHAAMHDRELDQVVATKKPVRGEVPFDGTNGRRIYDYIFVPVFDADGEVEAIAGSTRDITDRKEAEDKLADSSERLQAAIDGSGAGTYRWNIQTDEVDWDENLDGFFGLPPGETIRTLAGFIGGIHPDDRAEVAERCRRCAVDGVDFSMEFRVVRPDGSIRWLDDKGKTFLDEEGKPLYIAGTCMDVTERHLAHQWESSQKQILERIAKDAPLNEVFEAVIEFVEGQSTGEMYASILVLDDNGRNLRHGAAPSLPVEYCEAVDGIEIGEKAGSCGSAAYLKQPVCVVDIESDNRWEAFREMALRHNLRSCWSAPIFSNSDQKVLGTFAMYYPTRREPTSNDVRLIDMATRLVAIAMERHRSEQRIKASAERLQFMAESMPQKIFAADVSGEVDYFNEQWMNYTGRSFEEIRGRGWLDLIHPDDRKENERLWNRSVKTGKSFQFEHRIRNKDGNYRWHLTRAHAMRDEEGKVILWFGSNTDINTARLHLEEISRVSRAKDDFLAALSHELRTPLSPVLMAAASLEKDPGVPSDIRKQFAMIRRNVELEARLIDDLLDLTRISRGKLHIKPVVADIHELIGHTTEIVCGEFESKQIEIEFFMEAEHHYVLADPTRLQQVFWNLIKNALKFTSPGGMVSVMTRNGADQRVIISVEDTGIGIDEESLPNIFNAFEQGSKSNQHQYGGLGLGLAISHAVVEAHGGTIEVESEGVNQGSRFTVTLDWVADPPAKQDPVDTPALESSKLRLLIVEDDDTTRRTLDKLLSRRGYDVTTAENQSEALELFTPGQFDVVVSDLGLPDGSGLDLIRIIQSKESLPAIAMSGYGMEEDHRQSREAGFTAHLVKPVKLDELQTLLENLPLQSCERK